MRLPSIILSLLVASHAATTHPLSAVPNTRHALPVPILMYHYIRALPGPSDRRGRNLSVSPKSFAGQLAYLAVHGFHTTTFADWRKHLLPTKPVILTFDDGYEDAFSTAFPLLKQFGMVATFYIATGFIDHPKYMTWEQVKALKDAGMEIGAHTIHHVDLSRLSAKEQVAEVNGSLAALDAKLQQRTIAFAYPFGKYSKTSLRVVRASEIEFAATTHHGIVGTKNALLALPRLRMDDTTDMAELLP